MKTKRAIWFWLQSFLRFLPLDKEIGRDLWWPGSGQPVVGCCHWSARCVGEVGRCTGSFGGWDGSNWLFSGCAAVLFVGSFGAGGGSSWQHSSSLKSSMVRGPCLLCILKVIACNHQSNDCNLKEKYLRPRLNSLSRQSMHRVARGYINGQNLGVASGVALEGRNQWDAIICFT